MESLVADIEGLTDVEDLADVGGLADVEDLADIEDLGRLVREEARNGSAEGKTALNDLAGVGKVPDDFVGADLGDSLPVDLVCPYYGLDHN